MTTATPTHGRTVTNAGVPVELPVLGATTIRYRNPDVTWVETELEPLLDKLNARLEKRDEEPFESVWDALEDIQAAWPFQSIPVLLKAGLRHTGVTQAELDELPPSVFTTDEDVAEAINEALAIAFGVDPAELEASEVPQETTADPTVAGDAGGSTG